MKSDMKKLIAEACAAPEPLCKKEFLQKAPVPPVSLPAFVLSQIRYIRKWIWGVDIMLVPLAFILSLFSDLQLLCVISAAMPILAMTLLTESGRSQACGMAEFECSTRFSLKSVVLARLGILGVLNLALFLLLTMLSSFRQNLSLVRTGIYMLCPYLITVFFSLWTSRRFRTREASYIYMGIAFLVSSFVLILSDLAENIYSENYFVWWLCLLFPTALGAVREIAQMVKQTEELTWNLS